MLSLSQQFLRPALLTLVTAVTLSVTTHAQETEMLEQFALAKDRTTVLAKLIPGTEEYFYFHILHYQTIGRIEESEKLLSQWIAQHGQSGQAQRMLYRQMLLAYQAKPSETLAFFIRELGVDLDHQLPATARERQLPNTLDPQLIDEPRLIRESIQNSGNLAQLTPTGLLQVDASRLTVPQLREFLGRYDVLAQPMLVNWIVKELSSKDSQGFGSLPIHNQLTLPQLEELQQQRPDLLGNQQFIFAKIRRLRPNADVSLQGGPQPMIDYLEKVEVFTRELPPHFRSLRAAVLYHLLDHLRRMNRYDQELFLEYLQLPRHAPYILPRVVQQANGQVANLNEDFSAHILLPPIRIDEPLVRDYLQHFLKDAANPDVYAPYLESRYLQKIFVETKILLGVGDPQIWFNQLNAEEQKELRQRVELDWSIQNTKHWSMQEPVRLDVDMKNIDRMSVRVFRINLPAYYQQFDRPVNTDIDLDGLVAATQWDKTFEKSPWLRHRETIDLKMIEGRGVWIVELVGGGRRSRALVARGDLRTVSKQLATGIQFTVFDEQNQPVREAKLIVAGQDFAANVQGEIIVPFVDHQKEQTAILASGTFAKPVRFSHATEQYALVGAFHAHREALQAGQQTTVLVRGSVTLNGHPVSVKLLKDPVVTITATDLDGSQITQRFENIALFEDRETELQLRVPPRLHRLHFELSGKVDVESQDREENLQVAEDYVYETIRTTATIYQAQLTETDAGYRLEVVGHNGEAAAGHPVQLQLTHRAVTGLIHVSLAANESGHIALGDLSGITHLHVSGPQLYERRWHLEANYASWPDNLEARSGQKLSLPVAPARGPELKLPHGRWQLVATRDNAPREDLTGRITARESAIELPALTAGDYVLRDIIEQRSVYIRVTEGPQVNQYLLGDSRTLETVKRDASRIASVERLAKSVRVKLADVTKFTRVHLFLSRYSPSTDISEMQMPDVRPDVSAYQAPHSGYVSNLRLDDEYRYVLERQLATKYPGNMLPQPTLLMNPWDIGESEAEDIAMALGDAVPAAPMAAAAMDAQSRSAKRKQMAEKQEAPPGDPLTVEYLRFGGQVLANLAPSSEGVIEVQTADLADAQVLTLVVVEPQSLQVRRIPLAAKALQQDDLRLAQALPHDKHLAQIRTVMPVAPNQPFEIGDVQSARAQIYASIGDLYQYYASQIEDERFAKFAFLTRWHQFNDTQKHEKYNEFACHEMHLFIYFKDRAFFNRVALPLLKQKKDMQFVDHWLLGNDLKEYVQLWRFNQLNPAEKALLAARLDTQRDPVQRLMHDWMKVHPVDPAELHRQLMAALAGKGMDAEEQLSQSFMANGMGGMGGGMGNLAAAAPSSAPAGGAEMDFAEKSLGGLERQRSLNELRRSGRGAAPPAPESENLYFDKKQAADKPSLLYRQLTTTLRWAESNYYRLRTAEADADLFPYRKFWRDLAGSPLESPLVSADLLSPVSDFTEALLALAVVGLPLNSPKIESEAKDGRLVIRSTSPAVVVTEQIREVKPKDEAAATILLGHRFTSDQSQALPGQAPGAVTEFVVGQVYRSQVVLSNPTDQVVDADVLIQIPAGSLPVENARPTDSRRVQLQPYTTERLSLGFYFPQSGSFSYYGPTASNDEKLLTNAPSGELKVLAEPSEPDENSWPYLVQKGTADQIVTYLRSKANLYHVDLEALAPRMSDPAVFTKVTETLEQLRIYNNTLWTYGLKHNAAVRLTEYFENDPELVERCGPVLQSPLLTVNPVERNLYEHIEYRPLEVPRKHPTGGRWQIPNTELKSQWNSLMNVLAHQSQPQPTQRLELAYFLLLQQRVEDAIAQLEMVDRTTCGMTIAYDYLTAYTNFYRGRYEAAAQLANQYAEYPTAVWQSRFAEVLSQVQEHQAMLDGERLDLPKPGEAQQKLESVAESRQQRDQTIAAAKQASFDFALSSGQIQLKWQNLDAVDVNYYLLDIELLFTRKPFVQQGASRSSWVQPNESRRIDLPSSSGEMSVDIPPTIAKQNVLVELVAGSQRRSQVASGGDIGVQVASGYGQVQASLSGTTKPLIGAYVKVYAKTHDGQEKFWKDGYTDLRGRFDYASFSGSSINEVQRFAFLIIDPEHGALIREVEPPR